MGKKKKSKELQKNVLKDKARDIYNLMTSLLSEEKIAIILSLAKKFLTWVLKFAANIVEGIARRIIETFLYDKVYSLAFG